LNRARLGVEMQVGYDGQPANLWQVISSSHRELTFEDD
jgi:hypothetical protein